MLTIKHNPKFFVVLAFGGVLACLALYGCKSGENSPTAQSVAPATQPVRFALFGPPPKKSGAQLWSDNCMRCHNSRPPQEFSDAQWDVVVHHMRLRANLTGDEARKIAEFLKASH